MIRGGPPGHLSQTQVGNSLPPRPDISVEVAHHVRSWTRTYVTSCFQGGLRLVSGLSQQYEVRSVTNGLQGASLATPPLH